jgi:hypothetical protein
MKLFTQNLCRLGLLFSFMILVLIFNQACKKTDFKIEEKGLAFISEDQFFKNSSNSSFALNEVIVRLKEINKESKIIQRIVKENGYPAWDKVIESVIRHPDLMHRDTSYFNGADTIIVIPLIPQDSLYVSGFISAKLNGNISFSLYRGGDYHFYSFERSALIDSIDAEKAALQLMLLNKRIFGYKTFKVDDIRLFRYGNFDTSVKYISLKDSIVSSSTTDELGRSSSEICYTVSIPAHCEQRIAKQPFDSSYENNLHIPYNCVFAYEVCTAMPTIEGIPTYPPPGGGGGAGGEIPPAFPCPRLQGRNAPIPGCPAPGPVVIVPVSDGVLFPMNVQAIEIDPSISLNPNVNCVYENLNKSNMDPNLLTVLSGFYNNSNYNVKFQLGDINSEGKTQYLNNNNFLITINETNALDPDYSRIWLASTFIHEAFHARLRQKALQTFGTDVISNWPIQIDDMTLSQLADYFKTYSIANGTWNNVGHDWMLNNISELTKAIREFVRVNYLETFANINNQYGTSMDPYKALAIMGLDESQFYEEIAASIGSETTINQYRGLFVINATGCTN